MRCEEKCFVVEMEANGESQTKQLNARTPAEARKKIRKQTGEQTKIISVLKNKEPALPPIKGEGLVF